MLSLSDLCLSNEILELMWHAMSNEEVWEKYELTNRFEIFLWMLSEILREFGECGILMILQCKVIVNWYKVLTKKVNEKCECTVK